MNYNGTMNTTNTQIYEIFVYANELLKTDKQKGIEFLRNNRSRVVIEGYLKLNYDPTVEFQLPPGQAPFKRQVDVPDGYCLTDLKQEFRRMRVFTDPNMNLTKIRREQLWIQLCEGLFWKEADLIAKIKDRRIVDLYDSFTADMVREIFPGIIPDVVAEPVPVENIVPVDHGEDPSKISEEELIKESVQQYLKEEVEEKQIVLDFDAWKKLYFIPPTQDVIDQLKRFNIDVDKEIETLSMKDYNEYLKKVGAVAQTKVTVPAKKTRKPSLTTEKKSTGRKTASSKRPDINKDGTPRKKPGRKTQNQIS